MKKIIALRLLPITVLMIFSPVLANDFIVGLSGTANTYNNELAIIDFSFNGENVDNIRGNINYPTDQVSLFSVEKNSSQSDWNIAFDTSQNGRIYFNAQANGPVSSVSSLFSMTFVVHSTDSSVNITTSDIISNVTVNDSVIINQRDIDVAREQEKACEANGGCINEVIIPQPQYETRLVNKDQNYGNDSQTIAVSERKLTSAYLKSADFKDATVTPAFNKLTTSYKVEVDSKVKKLDYSFTAENPASTVDVSDEINNQIIVTVTSENDEVNSYVFTVVRTSNFTPGSKEDSHNKTNTDNLFDFATSTKLLLAALALVSIGFIIVGGYYIYIGAREP